MEDLMFNLTWCLTADYLSKGQGPQPTSSSNHNVIDNANKRILKLFYDQVIHAEMCLKTVIPFRKFDCDTVCTELNWLLTHKSSCDSRLECAKPYCDVIKVMIDHYEHCEFPECYYCR